METIGYLFLIWLVLNNIYEFFFSSSYQKSIYNQTAKDVKFNK